ncbi:MAG: SRPBCC family protein [Spongiibacteraceae bacterium]
MSETISVVSELDLPYGIDTVWPYLSDFPTAPKYVPGVGPITITGSGIGMVRRVPFEASWTDEKLAVMDHENHHFAYTVSAWSDDVDFLDYRSDVQLIPLSANSCRYRREGRFTVKPGVSVQSVCATLDRAYRISMNSFAEIMRARMQK